MADFLEQERKVFEVWAVKFGLPIEHHPTAPSTNYLNRDTTFAWIGWQGKVAHGVLGMEKQQCGK